MKNTTATHYENETDSCMSLYLKDISKIPLLSRNDEVELALKAQSGDKNAKNKIVNANLRFVVNIAKQYQGRGLDLMDLISEGNIGLLTAIDKFDPTKGFHFISYAVWWIRQSILKAIYEKANLIRLPQNRITEVIKIEKTRKSLKGNYSEEEELCHIAELLGMDKAHIREMILISNDVISLDAPFSNDADATANISDFLEDTLYKKPEEQMDSQDMTSKIEDALSHLPKREAEVLRYRYGMKTGETMSLKQVGDIYGITKERIRQIEKKALDHLSKCGVMAELEDFVA